jgi:hypothetical protein
MPPFGHFSLIRFAKGGGTALGHEIPNTAARAAG